MTRMMMSIALSAILVAGCGGTTGTTVSTAPVTGASAHTAAQDAVTASDVEKDIKRGSTWLEARCDKQPDYRGKPAFLCVAANAQKAQKIAVLILPDGTIGESAY